MPQPRVPVPVVLKHLERICCDFVGSNPATAVQLIAVFETIFRFLNERARDHEARSVIAGISNQRVWPVLMLVERGQDEKDAVTQRLLSAQEMTFAPDLDFAPCIFEVAPNSQLLAFKDLLQTAGVPSVPSIDTLTRCSSSLPSFLCFLFRIHSC